MYLRDATNSEHFKGVKVFNIVFFLYNLHSFMALYVNDLRGGEEEICILKALSKGRQLWNVELLLAKHVEFYFVRVQWLIKGSSYIYYVLLIILKAEKHFQMLITL